MWQQWVNVIAGVWLVVSSFVPSLRSLTNILITGVIVFILAILGSTFQAQGNSLIVFP